MVIFIFSPLQPLLLRSKISLFFWHTSCARDFYLIEGDIKKCTGRRTVKLLIILAQRYTHTNFYMSLDMETLQKIVRISGTECVSMWRQQYKSSMEFDWTTVTQHQYTLLRCRDITYKIRIFAHMFCPA